MSSRLYSTRSGLARLSGDSQIKGCTPTCRNNGPRRSTFVMTFNSRLVRRVQSSAVTAVQPPTHVLASPLAASSNMTGSYSPPFFPLPATKADLCSSPLSDQSPESSFFPGNATRNLLPRCAYVPSSSNAHMPERSSLKHLRSQWLLESVPEERGRSAPGDESRTTRHRLTGSVVCPSHHVVARSDPDIYARNGRRRKRVELLRRAKGNVPHAKFDPLSA